MKNKFLIIPIVFLFLIQLCAEDQSVFSISDKMNEYYFAGFELAELTQNSFRDLGPQNWTIHFGERVTDWNCFNLGWSAMAFNVDLAPEHIQDPAQAPFITGDRSYLTGDLSVFRLGFDVETICLSFLQVNSSYVFRIIPIIGTNLGYYNIVWLCMARLAKIVQKIFQI